MSIYLFFVLLAVEGIHAPTGFTEATKRAGTGVREMCLYGQKMYRQRSSSKMLLKNEFSDQAEAWLGKLLTFRIVS